EKLRNPGICPIAPGTLIVTNITPSIAVPVMAPGLSSKNRNGLSATRFRVRPARGLGRWTRITYRNNTRAGSPQDTERKESPARIAAVEGNITGEAITLNPTGPITTRGREVVVALLLPRVWRTCQHRMQNAPL